MGLSNHTNNYLEEAQQDAAGWWSLYSAPHYIYNQWYVAVRNDKDGDYLLPAAGYFAFQTK